jgi:FtsP/CotA-like multicopper oxidase with cupredoxin domain
MTTAVWFDPASGLVTGVGPQRPISDLTSRVRSFAAEAPQQNQAAPVTYSFGPLKAGTYLLQSGTHPAVQMQMGLYGVLEVYQTAPVAPATTGQAYLDASSAFDRDVALLLSEIDPVLHAAVATGQYGPNASPPAGWLTSTIGYHPQYFLVNGRPFTAGSSTPIGAVNKRVLLRFLNAGLETKVPLVQGQYVSILAEDGNFLSVTGPGALGTRPAPRQQYSVLLPAGKTIDAMLTTPPSPVCIPVYDRRLNLTNDGASPGGMFVFLSTKPGACP